MEKTKARRAGFTETRKYIDVNADMTIEEKQAYIEKIEKRCPIADNMANQSNFSLELKYHKIIRGRFI